MEYRAALKGHEILMRHPVPDDAEKMIEGLKLVCEKPITSEDTATKSK